MQLLSRCLFLVLCLVLFPLATVPAPALGGYGTVQTIGSGADTVLVLYAGGTPYEIGWWHGALLRAQVQHNVSTALAVARAQVGPTALRDAWNLMAPYVSQEFHDELQGLADGSGLPLTDVQDMHALPDLSEYHCSAFNAFGPATANGHMLQMRILDYSLNLGMQDNPLVIVATPTNGHRYVNISFAGFIGCIAGISSQGIGVSEMGDSFDYANETLAGIPMPFLLRDVICHATSLAQAYSMVQTAHRTSSYWYVIGDAEAASAYTFRTSPTIFDTWGPGSEPSPLPPLPNICYVGHYNDRLYADLSANYGTLNPDSAIAITRHNAMSSNLLDAVYDLTTQEIWVAYAEGLLPASGREFAHLATAEPAGEFADNFDDPAYTNANWFKWGPKFTPKTVSGRAVLELQGADDPSNSESEASCLAAGGRSAFVDGLTMAADVCVLSGQGGLAFGGQGLVQNSPTSIGYRTYVLALDPGADVVALAGEGEGTLAAVSEPLEYGAWYRVQLVANLNNFEVWFAPEGQTLVKIADVPHDVLHPGVQTFTVGGVGLFAENKPASTVRFDNFSVTGVPEVTHYLCCPNVRALREQPAVVPVWLNHTQGVARADFDLYYDTSILTGLTGSQVAKGALIAADANWTLTWNLVAPGHLRVTVRNTQGIALPEGAGELVRITFTVNPAAAPRSAALLNLEGVAMADGLGLPLPASAWDSAVRVARMAEYLEIDPIASPQYAGGSFTLTLRARDEYGDVPTGCAAAVNLADLTGTLTPASVALAAGSYSGSVSVAQPHAADQITATFATDSVVTGTSNAFQVLDQLAPPDGLTAVMGGPRRVNLAWQDRSGNETGFAIERSVSGGAYSEIARVAANTTSYPDTACTEGTTYSYRVRAFRDTTYSAYSNTASATTPPEPPTGLTATAAGSTQVNLAWTDNSAIETGYYVERKTGTGGTYSQIATLPANSVSYSNTGLSAGTTYVYRVRAYKTGLGNSAYSNEATVTTPTTLPAPSNLVATATAATRIVLSWTDNSTNETGFYVERKTGATGTWARISTLVANTRSYTDNNCTEANTYYYRVQAYLTGGGTSAYSNEAGASTPLIAPTMLVATAAGLSQINLTWRDNSAMETGYYVERKTGTGGTYAQVATLAANTTSWSNTGLTAGTTYVYRVRAYRTGFGASAYSNEATATTLTLPAAPSNLVAVATAPTRITLTWTDNASNETNFYIERKTGATGTWARIATVYANVVTYADSTCAEATTYYYRVQAYRSLAGVSAYSNEAGATTPLKPPTILTATAAGLSQVNLAWRDNSAMETGYYVERKTGTGGTYAQVATLAANTTSWSNTGLSAGTTYVYRVRAYRTGLGNSAYSNEATVTTLTLPAAPSNLVAVSAGPNRINLSWTDNSTTENNFYIERKTGATGTWARIATVYANVVTYADSTCAEATTYYYRVQAYRNLAGVSGYSNEANATTGLKAPSLLTATAAGLSQVNLAWRDNSAMETGYYVERKTGTSGTYAQVATLAANTTSWSNTGLSAGTTYVYRVRAYRTGLGNSAYSNEATVTTLTLPAAPSNLVAVSAGPNRINLSWTDNSTTESNFYIERKTGATGTWARIATVAANMVVYSDLTCAEATTYYYRVQAYRNLAGVSGYSNEANATTGLKAPSLLTATAAGLSQVNLAWRDNSTMETGYYIERKTGTGGTYAQVATLAANTTSWSNTGLSAGTTYVYRVRAYRTGLGNSAYSNEATVTTLTLPAAPSNLAATVSYTTRVTLTWTDNATTENNFYVERKAGATGTWARIATVSANITTYVDLSCAETTTYYYRVQAYRLLAGTSGYSNEASAATGLLAPTTLTALAGTRQVTLSWRDNSTVETGYYVERKTGAAGTYAVVATLGASVRTWTNTGLTTGTTYYYRVRAYKTGYGNSGYSNEVSATPL